MRRFGNGAGVDLGIHIAFTRQGARAIKKGDHTVAVRQFGLRFTTELSEGGAFGRELLLSSYEFYEDDPITAATISWPEDNDFTVKFDNGTSISCSWNRTNAAWTKKWTKK